MWWLRLAPSIRTACATAWADRDSFRDLALTPLALVDKHRRQKKGRDDARPKFREEMPYGTAIGPAKGVPISQCTICSLRPTISTKISSIH